MTPEEFSALASPTSWSLSLQALWYDAKGDWNAAHDKCQEAATRGGDWVHAYLHRKEGDLSNASYWYSRAGRSSPPRGHSLSQEWREIVAALLADETRAQPKSDQ